MTRRATPKPGTPPTKVTGSSSSDLAREPGNAIPATLSTAQASKHGGKQMSSSMITTQDDTQIYYKDWGKGQPIVFHHGWPLLADDWDAQMLFFLAQGYRVIAPDRRGHGRSSQTVTGNDL